MNAVRMTRRAVRVFSCEQEPAHRQPWKAAALHMTSAQQAAGIRQQIAAADSRQQYEESRQQP
jgi:hypothetical protein